MAVTVYDLEAGETVDSSIVEYTFIKTLRHCWFIIRKRLQEHGARRKLQVHGEREEAG